MWVVANPRHSATGVPHPRRNEREGRNDLQLEPFGFAVFTPKEMEDWNMSPDFFKAKERGDIEVYETDVMPKAKPQLPDEMKPGNAFDAMVAFEIAISEMHEHQLLRINLFRATEKTGKQWVDGADTTYLKTRHREVLIAAKWYLENFVDKMTSDQKVRLRDINRQLKAIDQLV